MPVRFRRYIWEHPEWPALTWDADRLAGLHADAEGALAALQDRVAKLPPELSETVRVDGLTRELVSSWQIEGERLDEAVVRAAVCRGLALPSPAQPAADPVVEGAVAALLDACIDPVRPVTAARLLDWHAGLFPTGTPGVASGRWRDDVRGAMQVVSGPLHRPRVHFEAPPAAQLEAEMTRLLEWMGRADHDPLPRAAVVHLWFVTSHPFDECPVEEAQRDVEELLACGVLEQDPERGPWVAYRIR